MESCNEHSLFFNCCTFPFNNLYGRWNSSLGPLGWTLSLCVRYWVAVSFAPFVEFLDFFALTKRHVRKWMNPHELRNDRIHYIFNYLLIIFIMNG